MSKPIKVLILEDSPDDAALIARRISQGGFAPTYEVVSTAEGLAGALDKGPWDILISDHSMPRFSAIKALEMLKQRDLDLPVLIVSGTIEPVQAVAAMKAGARDFIMKDDLTRLMPAVERELLEAANRSEKRKAEQRYLAAQRMESIGRLAGGVAHDFNNILTAILGYSSFLLKNLPAGDPNRDDVQEIKAAGERAALLTRQLLAFSRRQVIEPKVLELGAVIANMERLLRRLIGEDIDLVISAPQGVGRVKADAGQMEQVLMNLCVNARDAMPSGGRIKVETADAAVDEVRSRSRGQFEMPPGRYVMLSVTDTGTGMSPEVQGRIFEPFFTTKSPDKGTGLGLSTVYGIVKQSDGFITVDSEPGRGSSFRIYLPRVDDPLDDAAVQAMPATLRGSETILLVEDEERLRKLTKRILEQQGYAVLEASGGDEAMRLTWDAGQRVDLLVTDVVMPQMGGGEVARRVAERRPGLKVLYMSGYTEEVIADRGILKPGINFLHKPFAPEALARKVREVLDAKDA